MKAAVTLALFSLAAVSAAENDVETFAAAQGFAEAFPSAIRTVAVITPASCPDKENITKAIEEMRQKGIRVKEGKWLFEKVKGATGPSLEHRKEDFMRVWMDPEVDLVICTRGGSGAQDLIKVLDWEKMAQYPQKKLIGYSNITCLTGAMLRKKVGHPYAGPNLGSLRGATPEAQESFRLAMENKPQKPFPLKAIRQGNCKGGIYAGHLVLLATLNSMPDFKVDPAGRLIFVECVRRPAGVLQKAWTSLVKSGFFQNAAGVVFCHFTRTGLSDEELGKLLEKFAGDLTCPVYSGYPYGHLPQNYTLDFFARAEIRDNVLQITPETEKR